MSLPREVIPGRVYLVTRRCTQRQLLLRPDDETNNAFVYCLAYAAGKSGLDIIAFVANANHYHAVVVDTDGRIPTFLEIFHKLLAKHQNALRGRWENFWATEPTSLVELVGPDDIIAKIVYTLTNPVKDGMVETADEWPGAISLAATLEGKTLVAERPSTFFRATGKMPNSLELRCVPPPTITDSAQHDFRKSLAAAIKDAEKVAARERQRSGMSVLGREAILAQSPFSQPRSFERRRGLDPKIAARDTEPRLEAIVRLKTFHAAHKTAREGWLVGQDVVFPFGTWKLRAFASVARAPSFSTV